MLKLHGEVRQDSKTGNGEKCTMFLATVYLFLQSIEVELCDSVDKLQVFLHDGDALGVKSEEVGDFEGGDDEGLGRF